MDEIHEIMRHPNFGRAIRRNPQLKELMADLTEDTPYSDVFRRFMFDDQGWLVDPVFTDRIYERVAGETYSEYIRRVMTTLIQPGYSQSRSYGTGARFYSGAQTNYPLEELASRAGLTARVTSFKPDGLDASDQIKRFLGVDDRGVLLGLPIPDQETINLVQLFDKNNQAVNLDRIYEVFGINPTNDPSVFKRLKAFAADREISRISDPANPIKTFLFDPEELYSQIPEYRRAAQAAEVAEDVRSLTEAYSIMSDGLSIVTEAGMKRNLVFLTEKADELEAKITSEISRGSLTRGSKKHIEQTNTLNHLRAEIDKIKTGIKTGKMPGGFNTRVIGAVDYLNPSQVIDFTKGDAIYFSQAKVEEFLKKLPSMSGKSAEEIAAIAADFDFITSKYDVKYQLRPTGGVRAFLAMFHQPVRDVAYSNSLTMATMADLADPQLPSGDRFLIHSLKVEIDKMIEDIQMGKLTPGLRKVIDDYLKWDLPVDASPAEKIAAEEGKAYAKTLLKFFDSGGDLRTNPFMTERAIDIIHKHHFRKVNDKGVPRKIMFQGQERDVLMLRAPIGLSSRAHMAEAFISGGLDVEVGMASFDETTGRFRYNAADILAARTAQGGSDLDDALYSSIRYDPKTRRLLYHSLRDPNAMGEFFFYDVDIRTDPHMPSEIKTLGKRRHQILAELAGTNNKHNLPSLVRQLDEINSQLHDYFSGKQIIVDGKPVSALDIPTIDLAKRYAKDQHRIIFAPKGYEVTEESLARYLELSPLRGFVTSGQLKGRKAFLKRLAEQREAMSAASGPINPLSLFEFKGSKYTDFLNDPKRQFFRLDEVITKALDDAAKIKYEKTLDSADILRRIDLEQESRFLLGKFVNEFAVIERFYQDYLDIDRIMLSGVSREQAIKFQSQAVEVLKKLEMPTVIRESIIDAVVKTGSAEIPKRIPSIIEEAAGKLGLGIKQLQEIGSPLGIQVGLDPALMSTRGSTALDSILGGYGQNAKVSDILLSEDHPMAYISQAFKSTYELEADLIGKRREAVLKETYENMLKELEGFQPTALEETRAQEFLSRYADDVSQLRAVNMDQIAEELLAELEGGDPQKIALRYSQEAIHYRSLKQLADWGLLADEVSLDRQLLAVAKLSSQAVVESGQKTFDAIDSLMRGSALGDSLGPRMPSISDMYMDAISRFRYSEANVLESIRNIDPSDYENFMDLMRPYVTYEDRRLQFGTIGHLSHLDQVKLKEALKNKAEQMRYMLVQDATQATSTAAQRRQLGKTHNQIDSLINQLRTLETRKSTSRPVIDVDIPGLGRYFARENADKTAEAISADRGISHTFGAMKRLDRKAISDLMEIRGFRASAAGVGVFAGVGLLYGVTKDRTPEDMQGPPLLPGGSAYENYNEVPSNLASIYPDPNAFNNGTGGILYRINLNGSFDSDQVRDSIQSITGSPVDTRLFGTRQTMSSQRNSTQLMNELTGD